MLQIGRKVVLLACLMVLITAEMVIGSGSSRTDGKTAILLASFGTTVPSGVKAITHINSWKSILTAEGFEVQPVLEGLGSKDAFVDIFVEHIADAARERGISFQ
jgi:cobalamin biosynthesis Co2+ chelatase CbiK